MTKIKMEAGVTFAVKLTKDSFNPFEEIKESVYLDLEKDFRKALKRAGFLTPKVAISMCHTEWK